MARENYIDVIAQQFYGNRTGTEIRKDEVDFFLKGIIDPEMSPGADKTVDRKLVRIPSAEYLVVIYDQNQENQYVNEEFPMLYEEMGEAYRAHCGRELTMQVSCEIPEIGFSIHTRCIACRINAIGGLESIQPEDWEHIVRYFAK